MGSLDANFPVRHRKFSLEIFGEPGISDHSPSCIFMDSKKPKQKKPFKFLTLLNQHPEFAELIKICWASYSFTGTKMLCVSKKLKELKSVIRTFSKQNYSELEKRVSESCASLLESQQVLLRSPSPLAAQREKEAHRRWYVLAKAEESFLRQRSRIMWLAEGDSNSAFFHRAIATRQAQNHIHFLLNGNGELLDTIEGIREHIVDYYSQLLGEKGTVSTPPPEEIASLVPFRCSTDSSTLLSAPFSPMEIQEAFFSLPKNKSPGPDGYPAEFFTAHWSSISKDMIDAVYEPFCVSQKIQTQTQKPAFARISTFVRNFC